MKLTRKLWYINMVFPAKLHKSQVPLLLVVIGVFLLSIASITDAAKHGNGKHSSKHKSSSGDLGDGDGGGGRGRGRSGHRGRSNRVDSSFEMMDAQASSLSSPLSTTTKSTLKTTKKYTVGTKSKAAKGKATYRGSRNQFFTKNKLTGGTHGQHSWLSVANSVASEKNHQQMSAMHDDSKPTKYHYYPHNQHLYLLPECATQQVCSAVYLRLNYSQPLCACPNFQRPCSVSTRTDDGHTIPLVTGPKSPFQQVLTLVKTCEPTHEVRECRAPKDWSILALQNSRTGKAHYLVICRCPSSGYLEGPIAHSQPAYARVPGIRVYGMTCVRPNNRRGRDFQWDISSGKTSSAKDDPSRGVNPAFPWHRLKPLLQEAGVIS